MDIYIYIYIYVCVSVCVCVFVCVCVCLCVCLSGVSGFRAVCHALSPVSPGVGRSVWLCQVSGRLLSRWLPLFLCACG